MQAATVVLTNGRTLQGEVISLDESTLILEIKDLQLYLPIEDISSVSITSCIEKHGAEMCEHLPSKES